MTGALIPFRYSMIVITLAGCVDLTQPQAVTATNPFDGKAAPDGSPWDESMAKRGDTIGPVSIDAAPSDGPLVALGSPCALASAACQSGICIDGVCCSTTCSQLCYSCAVPGSLGTCVPVPAETDPQNDCVASPIETCGQDGFCDGAGACRLFIVGTQCAASSCVGATETSARLCDGKGVCQPATSRSCAPNLCASGGCASACTGTPDCQAGFFCDLDKRCKAKLVTATACSDAVQCASGFCKDGVCCSSSCAQICNACNLSGSIGTCTAVPDGQDPRNECPADATTSCGRTGVCNGAGACRLYPANTPCGIATCSGTSATPASLCNGGGACISGIAKSCGAYTCSGPICSTSCSSAADCSSGNICDSGVCRPAPVGLVLYWKLDEAAGTAVLDSSGNNFNGVYSGDVGTPTPSTNVPLLMFADPRSRLFAMDNRQVARIVGMPARLKPANDFTVSVWYRSTSLGGSVTEIVGGGSNYGLRLRTTEVEFFKNTPSGGIYLRGTGPNHLDGNWHHLAGVQSSGSGMKLYFDGVVRGSHPDNLDVLYNIGNDFNVGRHNDFSSWDFIGNVDEVRLYDRVLSTDEIAALAQGHF